MRCVKAEPLNQFVNRLLGPQKRAPAAKPKLAGSYAELRAKGAKRK